MEDNTILGSTRLRRYLGYSAKLVNVQDPKVASIRDTEFLHGLQDLKSMIVWDREHVGDDFWSTEPVGGGISAFEAFLKSAGLDDVTLRTLLRHIALRFPEKYTVLMNSLPSDIATYFMVTCSDTPSMTSSLN